MGFNASEGVILVVLMLRLAVVMLRLDMGGKLVAVTDWAMEME